MYAAASVTKFHKVCYVDRVMKSPRGIYIASVTSASRSLYVDSIRASLNGMDTASVTGSYVGHQIARGIGFPRDIYVDNVCNVLGPCEGVYIV